MNQGQEGPRTGPWAAWWALLRECVCKATRVSLSLFRIMVPILVAVKVLQELDLVSDLARPLAPLMGLVGLPPEMGLVWATAMLNNLYGGIVVLLSLLPVHPLTASQATVLCAMMLVAHTLPVELRIAQKAGARLLFQAASRFFSAVLLGWLLHMTYRALGVLQGPARILLEEKGAPSHVPSLWAWALGEVRNLLSIYGVILALFLVTEILRRINVLAFMERALGPVLRALGIGTRATTVTVIGLTTGISYGGGLIIDEVRSGTIPRQDVFYAMSLMGLSHALIEDTLLMLMIGGDWTGILLGRLLFSMVLVGLLVEVARRIPASLASRVFWTRA